MRCALSPRDWGGKSSRTIPSDYSHLTRGARNGLPDSVIEPDVIERLRNIYAIAVAADSFARAVAFAMSQPEDVDVNEILYRPTRQEY